MADLMIGQWAGKTADIVYAKVMGSGEFPIDMLRYDCCSPATEEDSNLIARSMHHDRFAIANGAAAHEQPVNWVIMVKKVLRERNRRNPRMFTVGRWNSFGCSINETDNHLLDRATPAVPISSSNAHLFSVVQ